MKLRAFIAAQPKQLLGLRRHEWSFIGALAWIVTLLLLWLMQPMSGACSRTAECQPVLVLAFLTAIVAGAASAIAVLPWKPRRTA